MRFYDFLSFLSLKKKPLKIGGFLQNTNLKVYTHPDVHSSIIYNSQDLDKCLSVDEWIKKLQCIHTMEFYAAMKKKEILPFKTVWMDLEIIILNEISQSEKDKYHMISFICGIW